MMSDFIKGGGHVNHSIFWTNLAPTKKGGGASPEGDILKRIQTQWGSLDKFVEKFNTQTAAIQGSGWGWLGYNKAEDRLVIQSCANQDPLSTAGLIPLLGIDVWVCNCLAFITFVGACLLPSVQECSSGVLEGNLESGELEKRCRKIGASQEVM